MIFNCNLHPAVDLVLGLAAPKLQIDLGQIIGNHQCLAHYTPLSRIKVTGTLQCVKGVLELILKHMLKAP